LQGTPEKPYMMSVSSAEFSLNPEKPFMYDAETKIKKLLMVGTIKA
jgi:hypothetical protein